MKNNTTREIICKERRDKKDLEKNKSKNKDHLEMDKE